MRFSFESRCRIVQLVLNGKSPQAAAAACGASRATGYRLWARFQQGGWAELADRPSTPKRQPRRLPPVVEEEILAARERSGYGPLRLAAIVGRPASTIGKVLRRLGRSRLPKPERDPIVRYERERPGELLHVDTKKLGRFWTVGKRILGEGAPESKRAGWQHVHVAIDDHSRLAYGELLASDDRFASAAFLQRARRLVRRAGRRGRARAERQRERLPLAALATDVRPARAWASLRPSYRPRTNGKAEALIKICLNEWAYRFAYPSSEHRTRAFPGFLRWYNRRRPHGSLGGRPPISRVSHVCEQYT